MRRAVALTVAAVMMVLGAVSKAERARAVVPGANGRIVFVRVACSLSVDRTDPPEPRSILLRVPSRDPGFVELGIFVREHPLLVDGLTVG